MDGAAIQGMVWYERKWCQSDAMWVADGRKEAYRDVMFEVLLLDRRYAHGDDGRFTQGNMSLRVHEHDSERRRYDGGSTSMMRRGGHVFEFSVSHCDLA